MSAGWSANESEAVRVSRILERNAVSPEGEALLEKFFAAKREPARLAIALRGYCFAEGVSEGQRRVFAGYLAPRRKIAAAALIELGRTAELADLLNSDAVDAPLLEELIRSAVSMHRLEAAAMLLRMKSDRFGFHDRVLTL